MTEAADTEGEGELGPYVPAPPAPGPDRPRRGAKVAVAAGLAVALVAGVLALANLTSSGGTGTPEDAVRKLVEAVAAEDMLGALEALVPAERAVLRDRVVDLAGELGRLGILDDKVDLGHVPGADIAVEGLELRSEALSDDLASVLVTGGRATFSVNLDALPLGPLVSDYTEDGRIESPRPETTELGGDDDMRLVTVRQDGDWFVSLGYTMAEAARRGSNAPVPDVARAVKPRGEATPEAAVRELARAGAALDAHRLVELTAPGEAAPLHAYASLFLDKAEEAAGQVRSSGVAAAVSELELSTEESGNEAHVSIDRLRVEITTSDGSDSFSYDGKCAGYETPGQEPFRFCWDDEDLGPLAGTPFAGTTLTVVRHDGSWYISPVATYFDATLDTLRALDRNELEASFEESGFLIASSLLNPFARIFFAGFLGTSDESADESGWYGYAPNTGCTFVEGELPADALPPGGAPHEICETEGSPLPLSVPPPTSAPLEAPDGVPATTPGSTRFTPTPSTTTP